MLLAHTDLKPVHLCAKHQRFEDFELVVIDFEACYQVQRVDQKVTARLLGDLWGFGASGGWYPLRHLQARRRAADS